MNTKNRIITFIFSLIVLIGGVFIMSQSKPKPAAAQTNPLGNIKHVFVILMENHDWSAITAAAAPYVNNTLIPMGTRVTNYHNIPTSLGSLHPSEPNYVFLEGGTNKYSDFTFTNDNNASASNSTASTLHLATQLNNAGLSWRAYQENVPAGCPINSSGSYAAKHNPFVFFKDVAGNPPSTSNTYCSSHTANTTALQSELNSGAVANYNFITPNLCNDMHDCSVTTGDNWLKTYVPMILNSNAYKQDGAIFITWDEGGGGNNPIGMIILSPFVKVGSSSTAEFSHASMVKTVEDIFNLRPYAGHAADASVQNLATFFGGTSSTPGPTPLPTHTPVPTPIPSVTPTPTPGAGISDLVVTNISWTPTNPSVGTPVTFSATIKNQGTGSSPNGVVHGIAFKVDGTEVNWSDNNTTALAPGTSRTQSANNGVSGVATWTMTTGSHQVLAYVDDVNRIAESNETNNTLTVTVPLTTGTTPTPAPTGSTCTPAATTLGVATYQVSITTAGNYVFWARLMSAGDNANSMYMQVDNNCPIYNVGDLNGMPTNVWTWVNYQNGSTSNVMSVPFTAGTHTIKITGRESGAKIDKFILINDGCVPTGLGDNCATGVLAKPGDFNSDGKVDGLDYVIWLSHYRQNVNGINNGDANSDGKVDGLDYVIWVTNYGH
jgi:phosphatidylinositol-3-phosphatase